MRGNKPSEELAAGQPGHTSSGWKGANGIARLDKLKKTELVEKALTANLARIIDYIKFAEAKNGALATLSSGWLVAIATQIANKAAMPQPIATAVTIFTGCVVAAGLLAISSFFPNFSLGKHTRLHSTRHDSNLLYFGDIANLTIDDYELQVRKRYLADDANMIPDEYMADICVQIAVTSRIAMIKYNRFKWALVSASIGLTILFGAAAWTILESN